MSIVSEMSPGRVLALLALLAGTAASLAMAQPAAMPSVSAGIYTEDQAIRGQTLYYAHCLACHGESMTGLDQAPPLAGPQFGAVWQGESLWSLVERIDTMPPTEPGKLSRAEAVDLLTYLLWFNGLPMGETPLSTERSVLAATFFEAPPLFSP